MNNETIELDMEDRSRQQVRLSVIKGPHAGITWVFDRETDVTIGRASPSQLVLADEPALSRTHMRLRIRPPVAELMDERSRNGTLVNGVRLAGATLQHGDRIGVGDTELMLEVQEETSVGNIPVKQREASDRKTARSGEARPEPAVPEQAQPEQAPPEPDSIPQTRLTHRRPGKTTTPVELTPTATTGPVRSNEDDYSLAGEDVTVDGDLPVVGSIVGSYRLVDVLGSGGMATVYKAEHRRSGDHVALKLIRADLTKTKKRLQLFVREAGLLGQLKHPRIVEFHEFGIHEERTPYLVMEYLETRDLIGLVDEQSPKQRIRTSLWVISRVLEALHYLHDQGIVHRDIKPGNILGFMEGHRLQVKLADFGLAKLIADAGISGVTSERSVRGTIAYMSPEQFRDSLRAGPADDLYSCGATLFRMVVGEVPNMTFQPESTIGKFDGVKLPPRLRDLIQKAIAPNPSDRFQTVEEFVAAIERLKRGSK